jgi:SAM-dependent methyltransferase
MKSSAFSEYARYYDLFYRGKDYAAEAARLDGWLRTGGAIAETLVDIGCGTGRHAREFSRLGWEVFGVDASAEMIERARASTPAGGPVVYATGLGATFELPRTVAAAVSLFHVASYHVGPGDLFAMVTNVRRQIVPGGRFIFDFWHGPGVLADPPVRRTRSVEEGRMKVTRISVPDHHPRQCRIDVQYDMQVEDPDRGVDGRVAEIHSLRYYFLPEIEFILTQAGFQLEFTRSGIVDEPLGDRSWYGLVGAVAT